MTLTIWNKGFVVVTVVTITHATVIHDIGEGMANVGPSCHIPAQRKPYWDLVGFLVGTNPHVTIMHVKKGLGQMCGVAQRGNPIGN